VAGVEYTVVSRTDWVRDATGVVTCSNDEAQADYLKLTSTVTSPASTNSPVIETGLLTPALGQLSQSLGTATVRLTDREGDPLVGVTVQLSGPSSVSQATNESGCATFGYITSGTYTASVPGYVDITSNPPASEPLVVYPGKASFGHMEVDRPASLRASFVPPVGNTFTPGSAMVWDKITVKNVNLTAGKKLFTRGSRQTSVDATGLFPYTNGVGVYAGDCAANDPSDPLGGNQPDYFQTSGFGFTELDPGDSLRSVQVQMPTLRVIVYRTDTSTNFNRAEVELTPLDAGCADKYEADQSFSNTRPRVFDLAVPLGQYTVCAATRTGNSSTYRQVSTTVDLRTVPLVPNRAITLTTTTNTGRCL
jgi:hypothetical protein